MRRFENVLFATQGLSGHSDALEQAIRIASDNRVLASGLIACPNFPSNFSEYQKTYEKYLYNSLTKSVDSFRRIYHLSADELTFPIKVRSSNQPAISIIQTAISNQHDLVIKEAETLNKGAEGFKAADMTLLRKCPCPVWLHRPTDKPRNKRRVAVAIDPSNSNPDHHSLSLRLLELARSIADTCDNRLHIISCWENYLESYLNSQEWFTVDKKQIATEIHKAKLEHEKALHQIIDEAGRVGEISIHHLHGQPDEKIPQCVNEEEIDILVMGTLARTGISGFVIGNTAENILRSIHCSLVAMKPEGFVSPIK